MKLLFDANLSPKVPKRLAELFPGCTHIFEVGLAANSKDELIWEYARENEFAIVSADSDFVPLEKLRGSPPRIVHLANCDYRTSQVELHSAQECHPDFGI